MKEAYSYYLDGRAMCSTDFVMTRPRTDLDPVHTSTDACCLLTIVRIGPDVIAEFYYGRIVKSDNANLPPNAGA